MESETFSFTSDFSSTSGTGLIGLMGLMSSASTFNPDRNIRLRRTPLHDVFFNQRQLALTLALRWMKVTKVETFEHVFDILTLLTTLIFILVGKRIMSPLPVTLEWIRSMSPLPLLPLSLTLR